MHIASRNILLVATLVIFSVNASTEDRVPALKKVACVGDSITYGAHLKRGEASYPVKLQEFLGKDYKVFRLGLSGATLVRKGTPNVWGYPLNETKKANPDIIIISLGTNDTCGAPRNCWDHKVDFSKDYRDLIDTCLALPSKPKVWICAPTPMVTETPGLTEKRIENLTERKPRLKELITIIKKLANEKNVGFIDLNTPLSDKPELFIDGVHPNKQGHEAIAKLVLDELKKNKTESSHEKQKNIHTN